jgi:hypothetical protein
MYLLTIITTLRLLIKGGYGNDNDGGSWFDVVFRGNIGRVQSNIEGADKC